jgi:pimeloyl-ACP methyl ester carboxylesterase
MRLCFLHGLDSSPQGTKARLLKQHYPDCLIPELPPDIYVRVALVEKKVAEPMVFTGSSLGGLTAVMYAMRHPAMVKGMILLAPAVGSRDKSILADSVDGLLESLYIPETIPTAVIAGIKDELIPISSIRTLVRRSPQPEQIRVHEVFDDHSLHKSLDLMLETIDQIRKLASTY